MVRVNKNRIKGALKDEVWARFARLVGNAGSADNLLAALRTLLTPAELIALEKRIAILVLLEKGWSYRRIGRAIDVTRNTVSAIKRGLGNPPKQARPYTPLPPLKLNENHWMKRMERGKKKYYMGVRVV